MTPVNHQPSSIGFSTGVSLRRLLSKFFAMVSLSLATAMVPPWSNAANVGLMQWSFTHDSAEVPVAVWYPTTATMSDIPAGPFPLHAASNAPMLQKKHPLVLISHGTGGSNLAHYPLAQALASAGYLVAALTHPGDNSPICDLDESC
ncbi:MAG: hypothetical protein WA888_01300 [Burkholderiaceae bacterium]